MEWVPEVPIEYDRFGRMLYNPMFHENMNTPWTYKDEQYLIEWYDKIGPEEMSFALDRTIKSTMQKTVMLRKEGKMHKPLKKNNAKNIRKNPL